MEEAALAILEGVKSLSVVELRVDEGGGPKRLRYIRGLGEPQVVSEPWVEWDKWEVPQNVIG